MLFHVAIMSTWQKSISVELKLFLKYKAFALFSNPPREFLLWISFPTVGRVVQYSDNLCIALYCIISTKIQMYI